MFWSTSVVVAGGCLDASPAGKGADLDFLLSGIRVVGSVSPASASCVPRERLAVFCWSFSPLS